MFLYYSIDNIFKKNHAQVKNNITLMHVPWSIQESLIKGQTIAWPKRQTTFNNTVHRNIEI